MRTITTLALGGLLLASLSIPAAAQERGPRPHSGAQGEGQDPGARPLPGALRARLIERFDRDGDGRLSESERAAARAWVLEQRAGQGRGPAHPEAPGRGLGRPAAPDRPSAPDRPLRPGLERLLERLEQLTPAERAVLRQRLAERLRAEGAPKLGPRPFLRLQQRPIQPQRPPLVRPGQRPLPPQRLRPQEPQRRGPLLERPPKGRQGAPGSEPVRRPRRA